MTGTAWEPIPGTVEARYTHHPTNTASSPLNGPQTRRWASAIRRRLPCGWNRRAQATAITITASARQLLRKKSASAAEPSYLPPKAEAI